MQAQAVARHGFEPNNQGVKAFGRWLETEIPAEEPKLQLVAMASAISNMPTDQARWLSFAITRIHSLG